MWAPNRGSRSSISTCTGSADAIYAGLQGNVSRLATRDKMDTGPSCHMFQIPQPKNNRKRMALAVSLIAHCLLVYFWLNRAPLFVQPSNVAWGIHGNSANLIY